MSTELRRWKLRPRRREEKRLKRVSMAEIYGTDIELILKKLQAKIERTGKWMFYAYVYIESSMVVKSVIED